MRLKLPSLKNSEWSVEVSKHTLGIRLSTKVDGEYVHAEQRLDWCALGHTRADLAQGAVECLIHEQERAIGAAVLGRPIN